MSYTLDRHAQPATTTRVAHKTIINLVSLLFTLVYHKPWTRYQSKLPTKPKDNSCLKKTDILEFVLTLLWTLGLL